MGTGVQAYLEAVPTPDAVNDEQLEREIQTIKEILRVRLRRYNREMRELDKDLRELRAIQRARRTAHAPVAEESPVAQEASP